MSEIAERYREVEQYIRTNWSACIRNNIHDEGTLIGMPHPYVVPCASGAFQEMYYWDTYFTNQGLLGHGLSEYVRNNTDNQLYLVNRFGFMPNGNRTYFLTRSQSPYLSMMVRDVYEAEGNKEWLLSAYKGLKKEYGFWMRERMSPTGLNRYGQHASTAIQIENYFEVCSRLKLEPVLSNEEAQARQGAHFMAEFESWDFTPRYGLRCESYNPVDLNCNLYMYETNFAYFSKELGLGEERYWLEQAEKRRLLLNHYCWDSDRKAFMDYDFEHGRRSEVLSAACYYPLFAGMADDEQAAAAHERLAELEFPYGLTTCKPLKHDTVFQWDHPNGWAPLQYIAVKGLLRYGYRESAARIAEKYLDTVTENFKATGNLWEKYNVQDGSTKVMEEYESPPMLGWTAGIYIFCLQVLNEQGNI